MRVILIYSLIEILIFQSNVVVSSFNIASEFKNVHLNDKSTDNNGEMKNITILE